MQLYIFFKQLYIFFALSNLSYTVHERSDYKEE